MQLDWEHLYREFTACAMDRDCAGLCRKSDDEIPACCDTEQLQLIVFTDELHWAANRTSCWRRLRPRNAAERRAVSTWADHIALARCVHPHCCDRPHRSLTCRFFPLEPYFDAQGTFIGLTYIYAAARVCPIIDGQMELRQEFVNQSFVVWGKVLQVYPDEQISYRKASRQLRYRFARKGRTIRVFRPTA